MINVAGFFLALISKTSVNDFTIISLKPETGKTSQDSEL